MIREPDWESLSEVNFLISRRMVDQLSAALDALGQIPQGEQQQRALSTVTSALDLHTAWADLIRHKVGDKSVLPGPQEFDGRNLLEWITETLQMEDLPHPESDVMLKGNRGTIQEALLLLQSCAHTLGPGVRVRVEQHRHGLWFRVRYAALSDPPGTLEELLASLRANWRLQSAAFEMRSAREFLSMNGCDLFYSVRDRECELAFFLWFAHQPNGEPSAKDKAKALLDSYNSDETYQVITD